MIKRSVNIPLPLVLVTAITLSLSLFVNIVTTVSLNLVLKDDRQQEKIPDQPPFPVNVRQASLTTIKSERFGLYGNSSDWDAVLPKGDGFIYRPEDGQHYLVSTYHHLHCLRSFRTYLRMAMVTKEDYNYTSPEVGHVHHCLIYFRQMVLCNSDVTLEPASHRQMTPDGKVVDTVTGIGITHRCMDWEQVWNYMEDNFEMYKDTYEP